MDATPWPPDVINDLAALLKDRDVAENVLMHYPTERVRLVVDDFWNSPQRQSVPEEHVAGVVSFCIRTGRPFSADPQGTLDDYLRAQRVSKENRRRQHTLPRSYLERFATVTTGARHPVLWAYRTDTEFPFEMSVNDATVWKYFYSFDNAAGDRDNSVEVGLSLLEGVGDPIIEKLVTTTEPLTQTERNDLCFFFATMWSRSPLHRERVYDHLKSWAKDSIRTISANPGTPPEVVQAINEGRAKIEPSKSLLLQSTVSRLHTIAPRIASLRWCLLTAPQDVQFITCDAPVVLTTTARIPSGALVGWGTPGLQVTLPLSSDLCLLMSDDGPMGRSIVSADRVDEVSQDIARHAHRYVFANRQDARIRDWICRKIG